MFLIWSIFFPYSFDILLEAHQDTETVKKLRII